MGKWQRIEEGDKKGRDIAPNEHKWQRLSGTETYAFLRTVIFQNVKTGQQVRLDQYLDWDGNLMKEEGDTRLRELMEFTISIESEFDNMEREDIIKKGAPAIKRLIEALTGVAVDEKDLLDHVDIRTDGNWKGFARGPKYQRTH